MKVTALLACHNRRSQTLQCLESYFDQADTTVELDAVLVDDGSVDGTTHAVRVRFPRVSVIAGTGDLYWARAMAIAERAALRNRPNYLLWLNDDVTLDRGGLATLLETTSAAAGDAIAVGAVQDSATDRLSYSGVRRQGRHPLRMELVAPGDEAIEVETFNGNVVLVPVPVAARVGPIDGSLVHAAADFDYGLRARHAGFVNLLTPGTVGRCELNPSTTPWLDGSLNAAKRLQILFGPKGLPPRSRARYLRRHGGPTWPVYWILPYIHAVPATLWATEPG